MLEQGLDFYLLRTTEKLLHIWHIALILLSFSQIVQ